MIFVFIGTVGNFFHFFCASILKITMFLLRGIVWILYAGYKILVRPFLQGACRFHPSCSEYALEAFRTYPPMRALFLTFKRLLRCGVGYPAIWDPVPDALCQKQSLKKNS